MASGQWLCARDAAGVDAGRRSSLRCNARRVEREAVTRALHCVGQFAWLRRKQVVMNRNFRYCPYCASPMAERERFNAMRPVCSSCEFVQFHDPKVAVIGLVLHEDRALLIQRAVDPAKGKWSLPGGYMDAGEMPEEALKRELMEEVGLKAAIGELIDIFPMAGDEGARVGIVLAFRARPCASAAIPYAADDAQDAGWFRAEEIPVELAFESTRTLLEGWGESSTRAPDNVEGVREDDATGRAEHG